MLFGYTNPDIINRHQKIVENDDRYQYGVSWIKSMDNYAETKEKHGEYPKVNKVIFPTELNEYTINDAAKNFQPQTRLFNSFYNGIDNNKEYQYGQQIYIPESYPSHYINTNKFSPAYIALSKYGN